MRIWSSASSCENCGVNDTGPDEPGREGQLTGRRQKLNTERLIMEAIEISSRYTCRGFYSKVFIAHSAQFHLDFWNYRLSEVQIPLLVASCPLDASFEFL